MPFVAAEPLCELEAQGLARVDHVPEEVLLRVRTVLGKDTIEGHFPRKAHLHCPTFHLGAPEVQQRARGKASPNFLRLVSLQSGEKYYSIAENFLFDLNILSKPKVSIVTAPLAAVFKLFLSSWLLLSLTSSLPHDANVTNFDGRI